MPKIKARLELWERFKPSLFARANVALTMIASCARYHASCAAASRDAIKELQTLIRKFVWKGRAPVCTDLASVPRRLGGLGLPNIQAIQDAHHLRFWAQAMNSDEDWAWALRHDAATALRVAKLSHPLDNINKRVSLPPNSLGAVIVTTLRKRLGDRFRLREVDLCALPFEDKQALLNSVPQFQPRDPSEPRDTLMLDPLLSKIHDPLVDTNLALIRGHGRCDTFMDGYPLGSNFSLSGEALAPRPQDNDEEEDVLRDVLNDPQAILEEQDLQQQREQQEQEARQFESGEKSIFVARTMEAPPDAPSRVVLGKLSKAWSWAILPSPLTQLPFTSCGVRHFTLSLILDSPKCEMSHLMKHPDWSEVTWNLVRRMPVTKVASLIWHIGTGRMRPTPCRRCNCEAGIDHIVFKCPTAVSSMALVRPRHRGHHRTELQAHLQRQRSPLPRPQHPSRHPHCESLGNAPHSLCVVRVVGAPAQHGRPG